MANRIVVCGATGRMGRLAVACIDADPELELVGTVGRTDSLRAILTRSTPDVVVDVTTPSAVFDNAMTIINAKCRPIIGTSGLTSDQQQSLRHACDQQNIGGLIVPNFSISAVLMMRFAVEASRYFDNIEIVECHHSGKRDAPSGTALRTAQMIADAQRTNGSPRNDQTDIPIHSIRLSGFLAHQDVIFGGAGQALTIRADSFSHESFADGICLACRQVTTIDTLECGLEHVMAI